MSWSVSFIGTPEKVSEALTLNSEKLSGDSKSEFDAALPHLKALVEQNFNSTTTPPMIKITANGHGMHSATEHVQNECRVTLENVYGLLV